MSISGALSNALTGMSAASRRAELTSNNIANASTEGYASQSIGSSSVVVGGRGAGVQLGAVERAGDPRLTASRREADAQAGASAAQASGSRDLADALGGPPSLFDRLSAFENTLRGISENPESTALQERAVTAAGSVVSGFGDVSDGIAAVRTQADTDIGRAVDTVNSALAQIKELNVEIQNARATDRNVASFEQARDDQLDIVSEYLPIRLMPRDNGAVAVLTDTGVTLLDGNVREISFTPTAIVTAGMDRRAGVGPLSGLSVDGIELAPREGIQALSSGSIAGLFETRDGYTVDALGEVDALAADVVRRFESAGVSAADGRGLFTDNGGALAAAPAAGLAGRLSVNEQIDPAQGGEVWRLRDGLDAAAPGAAANSTYATALLDAMTAERSAGVALPVPGSAASLAASLGSLFETRAIGFEDRAATANGRQASLLSSETAISGVDIDRELQNLLLIEQAYAANARVIEVSDRLIQRLLEI